MPGATSLGIRYPLEGETVTAQSWQDMADDIDALFTDLDTLRIAGLNRATASVSSSPAGVGGIVSGTTTTMTYTIEDWDTGGYANLGVNNDRLTLPTGLYFMRFSTFLGIPSTINDITLVRYFLNLNGIAIASIETDENSSITNNNTVTCVYPVMSASSSLTGSCRFNGTGTATMAGASLQAYKIRELLDQ
jgi:hypothetical protein